MNASIILRMFDGTTIKDGFDDDGIALRKVRNVGEKQPYVGGGIKLYILCVNIACQVPLCFYIFLHGHNDHL